MYDYSMTSDDGVRRLWKCSFACLVALGLSWSSADGENSDWENAIGQPGLSGWVWSLVAFNDGLGEALYVGGSFGFAGDLRVNRIARWNGEQWAALGGGMNGFVRPLAVFDDGRGEALYAGGHFTRAGNTDVNYIARWNGRAWSSVGGGMNDFVQGSALVAFDDGTGPALYAGGSFTEAGGVEARGIARWDGEKWTEVGGGVHGPDAKVSSLAVFDDGTGRALFVGGMFEAAGSIPARNIAKWDGEEWHSLGAGLSGGPDGPKTMTVFNDGTGEALYVGGFFTHADNQRVDYVARWNGESWSSVGAGLGSTVRSLVTFDDGTGDALYAGGFFGAADGIELNGIAKWDGEKWSPLGMGVGGDTPRVYGMKVWDDGGGEGLYLGGTFTSAGGLPSNRVSLWGRRKLPEYASFQDWLENALDDGMPADPENLNPESDPNRFGIPNLLRYAFALDAHRPDRGGLPYVTFGTPGGLNEDYLMITFTRRIRPPDLEYKVEAGNDLFGWGTLGEAFVVSEVVDETEGTKTVTVRDSAPINQSDQRFLRVRVEMVGE
jgi:hypothetical protein